MSSDDRAAALNEPQPAPAPPTRGNAVMPRTALLGEESWCATHEADGGDIVICEETIEEFLDQEHESLAECVCCGKRYRVIAIRVDLEPLE